MRRQPNPYLGSFRGSLFLIERQLLLKIILIVKEHSSLILSYWKGTKKDRLKPFYL
jgi:hypothetical protein